jgi:hypothetical protein
LPPVYPGERGRKGVLEERLDGSLAIRFGGHYLKDREIAREFIALAADASGGAEEDPAPTEGAGQTGVQPTGGRSGRTCGALSSRR